MSFKFTENLNLQFQGKVIYLLRAVPVVQLLFSFHFPFRLPSDIIAVDPLSSSSWELVILYSFFSIFLMLCFYSLLTCY